MSLNKKIIKYYGLFLILLSIFLIIYGISGPFRTMIYRNSVGLPIIPGNFHGTELGYVVKRITNDWISYPFYFFLGILPGLFYFKTAAKPSRILIYSFFFEWLAAFVLVITFPIIILMGGDFAGILFMPLGALPAGILYGIGILLTIVHVIYLKKSAKI